MLGYRTLNNTEKEIAGITGEWQGKHLKYFNPLDITCLEEAQDFMCVMMLYNAELLDDMMERGVAQKLLREIRIPC